MIDLYIEKSVNFSTIVDLVSKAFNGANVIGLNEEKIVRLYVEDTVENRNLLAAVVSDYSYEDDTLSLLKATKIKELWHNLKSKQEQYFYDLDIVEARRIASRGESEDKYEICLGVRSWVDSIFAEYYTRKDSVYAANSIADVNEVSVSFESFEGPAEGFTKDGIWR